LIATIDNFSKVEGKSYKFLVRAVNELGDSPDLITEDAVVAKNPFDPPCKYMSSSLHT